MTKPTYERLEEIAETLDRCAPFALEVMRIDAIRDLRAIAAELREQDTQDEPRPVPNDFWVTEDDVWQRIFGARTTGDLDAIWIDVSSDVMNFQPPAIARLTHRYTVRRARLEAPGK